MENHILLITMKIIIGTQEKVMAVFLPLSRLWFIMEEQI